jgi:hypothetical protein
MPFCPWCMEDIVVGFSPRSRERVHVSTFAAHVQRCEAAPESARAAYRAPLYPAMRGGRA